MKTDKEAHVRGICEQVNHHLWTSDSRPAYKGIAALRSSTPKFRTVAIKASDGKDLTDDTETKNRWAEYFEQLLAAVPPARELNTIGIPVAVADPPISCEPPTIAEISMVVDQLKAGKAAGICGIPGELLRAGGHAVLLSLCTLFHSI